MYFTSYIYYIYPFPKVVDFVKLTEERINSGDLPGGNYI